MWQRACLRTQVLRGTLPQAEDAKNVAFWGDVLDVVKDAISQRRAQMLKEKTEDQKA